MNDKKSNQLKDKLWESDARFKAAFESAKDCILIWDKDYNYLYANRAAIDHVGTTPDKVIGKNIRDGLGHIPDFMHLWMGRIDQVFETAKVLEFQDKTTMQESLLYSESILTPIFKSDGSVSAVCVVYRDITERKQDEDILKRQRDFSESIINTSNAIIVGLDKNHKIQLFNEGAEKITGYQKTEMIDKDWFHMFFPSDIADEMIGVWDEAWGVNYHTYENPILTKNGDQRIISWQSTGMYEGDEENHLLISIGEDITESKQAEEKLKESEERYRLMATNTLDTIWTNDLEFNVIFINDAVFNLLGYTSDEFIGLNADVFTTSESMKVVRNEAEKICVEFKEGNNIRSRFEIQQIRKDGAIIDVEIRVNPYIDEEGKFVGYQGSSVDITDRKRAEEKLRESDAQLRNIFENSTSLYYAHTPDHKLRYLSPQVKEMLGYTVAEAKVKWTELATENPMNASGFQHTVRAIETCRRQPPYELELVRKDGRKINVEVREFPLVENGKTTAIVGSLMDITARKAAEAEILKLKDGLEKEVGEKTIELKEKIGHLERFYNATIDRELRMKELYDENEKLKKELKKKNER